jgi:formylglycine-generating enzyme required for sulfatase activity
VTRAGTATDYWVGDRIGPDEANFAKTQPGRATTLGRVDTYRANPFGLFQVHGNIFDWTSDCLNSNYVGAPNDGSSWNTGDCAYRAVRGGSWITPDQSGLRSAARRFQHQDDPATFVGFRVARSLLQPDRFPAQIAAGTLLILFLMVLIIGRLRPRISHRENLQAEQRDLL